MNVYHSIEEASGRITKAVVTTGSFDGVHVGHKIILNRLIQLAESINGESTLVTFHPHPRKVLYPDQKDLKLINSQEEKIELLSKTGLQNLVIIPFSVEFSKTTSKSFILDILVGQFNAHIIIVGKNHHFGHNRSGDYSYLHKLSEEMSFRVEEIPLKDIENETVSSTKIRKSLFSGNIMRANAYLDHQYIITGRMSNEGFLTGASEFPFFRVIIGEEEKLVPPGGIYATNILKEGKFYKSMTIIHEEGGNVLIDNTLLYDDVSLQNQNATIYFYKKMCGNEKWVENPDKISMCIEKTRENIDELIY